MIQLKSYCNKNFPSLGKRYLPKLILIDQVWFPNQLERRKIISCHFRSAAYIKMGQFSKAYQDAVKAKELNAEWPKVRFALMGHSN